jgi:hypothetical protein
MPQEIFARGQATITSQTDAYTIDRLCRYYGVTIGEFFEGLDM